MSNVEIGSSRELHGKVAIVTGAGRMRSIGRPIARILAAAGASVVITGTGRRPEDYPDDEKSAGWRDIASVADEVRAAGGSCLPLVSDIRDENAVEDLVKRTISEFGRVDIVVNNASAARGPDRVPTTEMPLEVWKKVFATNVDGTFLLSRVAARRMIAQGEGGSIVNISSIASKLAHANMAAYAASKAAINALSRSMALELAPHKIRVNAICPGIIDTFRMDDLGRGETWKNVVKTMIPLGYPGDGSECAELVLFLVTDHGKWITGQAINVDGGTVWN
ncbi:MAG TPA: SDR family NAD(P)-dependent oxidoreductase [Candidatus Binataceae bacterium]|jgi:3-oxoacyl-[acyl-carrier protein] reductase/meso-butanediol dehydrogenase/(S,S)-butanediol dehydrogenase/diacetyl reductase|nr:SDR family NAD(P)-dependent oxidoreductase [Candidatus Binataceae bacterium]